MTDNGTHAGAGSHPLHDSGVIADVTAEYDRAKAKHGENTLDGPRSNDLLRLAALVEEVGEVAHELTYDQEGNPEERAARLRAELIDVANVAVTWASIL
jgi:NTP pyrophosphatase (non-canonical NTP hydrolase)